MNKQYLVYNRLAYCRLAIPEEGLYSVLMINPRTGERQALPDCDASRNKSWHYPRELQDDWVFILNRKTP